MIGAQRLRRLRNDLAVHEVLRDQLGVRVYSEGGYWRFQCPLCHQHDTATSSRTNLARCFRCLRNFNPIDLVMLVHRCGFLEAVRELERIHPAAETTQNAAGPDHR